MDSSSRVAFLDRSRIFAGAEQSLATLIQSLDRRKHSLFLCFDYRMAHQDRYREKQSSLIYLAKSQQWWMGTDCWKHPPRGADLLARLILAARLGGVIRKHQINILHVNLLRTNSYWDLRFAKWSGAATVGHIRSLHLQNPVANSTLNLCDRVVCTSKAVLKGVREACAGEYASRLVHIYDPVADDASSDELLSAMLPPALPPGARFVCSVGILDPRKGHDTAIAAFAEIATEFPEAHLLIAGGPNANDVNETRRLRGMADACGLSARVLFLGHVSNMAEVYRASELVYALSKDGEAFGRVPVEAALAERIAIGTPLGATPEIIQAGVTGILVPPNAPSLVADWTRKVLRQPGHFRTLAKAALTQARLRFSPEVHVRAIESLYAAVFRQPWLRTHSELSLSRSN